MSTYRAAGGWVRKQYQLKNRLLHRLLHRIDEAELSNWRKGATGEELVGATLDQLDDQFRVINDESTGRGNIDHIVIGPTGIFAIETKAWTGRIWTNGRALMYNGTDTSKTIGQALAEAFVVKDRLAKAGIPRYVQAVICLTATKCERPITFKNVKVVGLHQLYATIASGAVVMDSEQIGKACMAIMRTRVLH